MPDRPIRPRRSHRPRQDPAATVVPSGPAAVARPVIPDDVDPWVPRGLRRAIGQQVRDLDTARDVQRAVAAGGRLLDEGRGDEAVALFSWAKMHASRVPDIREGLGVAHYQAGAFREAMQELRTYRRMSASHDQDHLIADCLRGLGRPVDEVAATVQELLDADGIPPDRQVEGLVVWAGALRDAGDIAGGRAVLRRADRDLLRRADDEAGARLAYLSADLAAADGDLETARAGFRRLADLPGDPLDAGARLAELGT